MKVILFFSYIERQKGPFPKYESDTAFFLYRKTKRSMLTIMISISKMLYDTKINH